MQLQLLQHQWVGHRLGYCDIEWFALETNQDHAFFLKQHPVQFSSVTQLYLTLCDLREARQASLSMTNSQSLLKLMSIKSMTPSSHLILCRPLLLLPPIPPSFRVFSNESTLCIKWPKYWSFSFSIIPSKVIPGLISFRT